MLQTIRERAQGWIAWAIVILISIPFALWGVQSYVGTGSEPVAATVNGVDITERELDQRFQRARAQLRERLGAAYDPEMFDDKTLRRQVLDQTIRENLLTATSHAMGLRASDQEVKLQILSNQAFMQDGRFDKGTYERMLELQGMSPAMYENQLRQRLVGTQLVRAVLASELVTDAELDAFIKLSRQKRDLSYVRILMSDAQSDEPIPDAEISAYYGENLDRFAIPEQVKISYLVLNAESIGSAAGPSKDDLRALYEEEIDRYKQSERRHVRHILLTLDADADDAAAEQVRAEIEAVRERLVVGEEFAAVAKEVSKDPGSAAQGGDLGTFERGLMVAAFDEAAFSLEVGQLSDPVRSSFGYHLILVDAVEAADTKPFDEVKAELLAEAGKQQTDALFYEWAERLSNVVYETPDSLEPAAEELGLEIQTSEWVPRTGGEGLLSHPKLTAAAFSDDVLKQGNNSELIEPEREVLQAVVLRVLEHREAATKPLDEVRDEIIGVLREQKAKDVSLKAAEAMVEQLRAGASIDELIGDYKLEKLGLIGRNARVGGVPEVVESAFTRPRMADEQRQFSSVSLANGDAAVVIVDGIEIGSVKEMDEASRERERTNLSRQVGRLYYDQMLSDMEARASIKRRAVRSDEEG